MTDDWTFPGSRWWKFDFHTHTPASNDYGRGHEESKHIEAQDWLQKAMESKLDCVVITDHNSGGWIDKLKSKNSELRDFDTKPDWYRELTIFPGVEIAVTNGNSRIHLLAVFDPSCDSQTVTGVLGACGITAGFGDDENTYTTKSFVETVKQITEAGGIAIPAHIDSAKGLLEGVSSLTPELRSNLDCVTAAEFCDPNKFKTTELSLMKKVEQLAKLAGSDAHTPEKIGKYYSWLKMTRPSIEGLRMAMLDHEFCVKNQLEDPNRLPDIYLSRLTVSNMRHCGRIKDKPFVIDFHPHFNSIIGGRGTGKSTVLESIRIVSRRYQMLEKEAPRIKTELDRFMQLSPNKGVMQNDSEILLALHRSGKNYQLRWRHNGTGAILEEELVDVGWKEIDNVDLAGRFPISIYSQKQINELSSNTRGLLEIVDRSSSVDRAEWTSRFENVKSRFLQLREHRRELLRQLAGEQQLRARLVDVENDLKQYEEKGHGEVLKQYQKRSQQKNGLPDDRIFDELSSGIKALVSNAELSDFPAHLFDEKDETTTELKAIHEQIAQELSEINDVLDDIAQRVDDVKTSRTRRISESKWHKAVEASILAYDNLVREYEEKKSQISISLYGEWVQRRNQLQQQLKMLDSVRTEAESTGKQIKEYLGQLQDLRAELFEKRQQFLNDVIGGSSFVRMELVPYGDASTVEDEYRSLLGLDGRSFASSIYENDNTQSILFNFRNWEDSKIPESELPQLISRIKERTFNVATGRDTGSHGAFDNRMKKLIETNPAVFDRFDVWWPEDMLRVKYARDPASGKFEDLEKGSAGQKAAAILAFLLSYGTEPLIIDQPEDDLDNALIYELIVKQIHKNKNRRQLIIVTHNPNIVVNGDSELVHVLRFQRGQVQIDRQGGLEEFDIREAICTIMEGGRQAFDKRYKRITLEI